MGKQVGHAASMLFTAAVAAAVLAAVVGPGVAAASGTTGRSAAGSGRSAVHPVDPWGWPGTAAKGYLPPHEPAIHGGKVTVGLITAGTVHDHGYYQSEVTTLDRFATRHHWKTIVQGSVNPANAATAAANMCSQHVDLLIVGESELAAAVPVARSSVCKGIPFWMYASKGTVTPSPYLYLAETTADPQSYLTGVAMGMWMKAHHVATAGFIAGPALSFTERPAQAYLAGMRSVVHNATLDAVYTGSFTASGPAITAAQSMITKGIKLIFPYLGGALYPTAKYIVAHGGVTISDGGNYCSHQGVKFAIRQVYDLGYLLPPALREFAHGKMRVGVVKDFVLGVTKVPNVAFCKTPGVHVKKANRTLDALKRKLAAGKITATSIIDKTPKPT